MKITAAKVEKFIETHLRLTEGPWAGQPFRLLPWQRQQIRALYDDRLTDGSRRVQQMWLETPKGNGKSPFAAALGVVEMFTSGPGALVMSAAATYSQAHETTFKEARNLILTSPTLSRMCEVQERQIKGPDGCRWIVLTSDGRKGKAGYRPTCAIVDEVMEQPDRRLIDSIEANQRKLGKRQPLLLLVSNAGRPDTLAADWHAKAVRYTGGERGGDLSRFHACLYGLAPGDDWKDRKLWAAANPALGEIITMEALETEFEKALKDPAVEYRFRTLHLGQWVQQTQTGYLDGDAWARCQRPLPPDDDLRKLPCWLAFDLSVLDDLTAVVAAWVDPATRHIFVRAWHWIPAVTAAGYEQDGVPYTAWARAGAVTLSTPLTIDHTVKEEIASHIESLAAANDVQQLCYDQYRAAEIVARLERSGLTCEPIRGNIEGLSPATKELKARLTAGSITFAPNPCLDWQSRNLQVLSNTMGDVRPVKPQAKGRFAGTRGAKIDGMVATILALTGAVRFANRMVDSAEASPQALYL